jgi:pimeloyl-ACP methyl ester carboxylesterase
MEELYELSTDGGGMWKWAFTTTYSRVDRKTYERQAIKRGAVNVRNCVIKDAKRTTMAGLMLGAYYLACALCQPIPAAATNSKVPDRYVPISGSRIHAMVTGYRSGPAVVFESGMGEDATTWSDVQPVVARLHPTVAYDRPGLGKSAATSRNRDAATLASDLHELLHNLNVPPPYILVGHSLGGFVLRVFAHTYPQETAGLVFVDPVPEDLEAVMKFRLSSVEYAARLESIQKAQGSMPGPVFQESQALEISGREAAAAVPLPRVPTILLTGAKKNPRFPGNPLEQDVKLQLHEAFLATLYHPMHVIVPESRHYIQNDQPQCVVDAITAVSALINAPAAHR